MSLLGSRACMHGAVSLCVLSLASCTPYILSDKLDSDISPPQKTAIAPVAGEGQTQEAETVFAGDIADALDAANDQRKQYFGFVRNRSRDRNLAGAGLIALSAGAVYKGVTSDSGSTKRQLSLLGATGAGIYGATTFLTNKDSEAAYLSG